MSGDTVYLQTTFPLMGDDAILIPTRSHLAAALDARRAAAPAHASNYAQAPGRPWPRPLCYSPGIPGTPDITIPGTPGTLPIGDNPGIPGTPDIVIPGQPAIPGSWYPC